MQTYYIIILSIIVIVSLSYGIWMNDYQEGAGTLHMYGNTVLDDGTVYYNSDYNRTLGNGENVSASYVYGNVVIGGDTVTNQPGNVSYNSSSAMRYDPNNYDTVFHREFPNQNTTLSADKNSTVTGNIVYYQPGSYRYGASSYVPYYEDSVFLSRSNKAIVNSPTYVSSATQGGFCSYYSTQPDILEEKCNAIDAASCAATTCCVLLGGQKCVSGNQAGPTMKANYSDFLIKNKDFYYYQGKCYGNCPSPNPPVPTLPPPPPQNMPPLPPQGMVIGRSA
jgi:hypothetical protein